METEYEETRKDEKIIKNSKVKFIRRLIGREGKNKNAKGKKGIEYCN